MAEWVATPEKVFTRWCVVERHDGRTVRVVADNLTPEEAALIANAGAVRDALEEMLNAALEERLPSDEVRRRAMDVFLASQGVRGAA